MSSSIGHFFRERTPAARTCGRKFALFVPAMSMVLLLTSCRSQSGGPVAGPSLTDDSQIIAVQKERMKSEITGKVRVYKLLKEDEDGLRHERFLVVLSNGTTVKVAHSIDIAPFVPVAPGDEIIIHGEYIWNDLGGVIHWTHHSDSPRHEGGWIDLKGVRYQ